MITHCSVKHVSQLNAQTYKISLMPISDFTYLAGQYVSLILTTLPKLVLSIASAPSSGKDIEVQVGGASDGSLTLQQVQQLIAISQQGETVAVEGPSGHAWLRHNLRPLVLIAGGSGFSYARSLLFEQLSYDKTRQISLYWGGKSLDDLYCHEDMLALQQGHAQFNYVPVIESSSGQNNVNKGQLLDICYEDDNLLRQADIYICGRFNMVKIAYHHFVEVLGILPSMIFSDALSAPQ